MVQRLICAILHHDFTQYNCLKECVHAPLSLVHFVHFNYHQLTEWNCFLVLQSVVCSSEDCAVHIEISVSPKQEVASATATIEEILNEDITEEDVTEIHIEAETPAIPVSNQYNIGMCTKKIYIIICLLSSTWAF